MSKISRQVKIAHTPVNISTSLPEEVLLSVIAFVEERFNKHDKSANAKSDELKKTETLIITLLDLTAELFSLRAELKMLKQSDSEAFAILNKQLENFSDQINK